MMGKRKQSEQRRLITFAMTTDEGILNAAIESIVAIRDTRFPKATLAKAKTPRLRS